MSTRAIDKYNMYISEIYNINNPLSDMNSQVEI